MDLSTVEFHYNELQKLFGDQLPNPEHHPIQFAYFIKLYAFYNKRQKSRDALVPTK